ncbi:MAG: hypothetical protein M1838_005710 [Thelocarpon superellum]|nr:MAG: hypothetical protein M1838_005710 [Thelocarpon superellum]
MDLITRMLSLTVPSSHNTATWEATVRTNPQIGRDERESLWVGLPQIHTATLQVIATLVDRLRCAFVPLAHAVIDQIIWIFRAEEWSLDVRQEVYIVLSRLLALMGPSLTKSNVTSLGSIIRRCCDDLLPSATTPMSMVASSVDPTRTKQHNKPSTTTNADAFLGHSKLSNTDHPLTGISASSALTNAAKTLLSILLAKIPPQHIKFQLRAQMDRTAILTADKQAMLASVLQPPVKEGDGKVLSSILPHLARSHGGELEVEGLLRPRMPVLRLNTVLSSDAADQEDEEDEEGGEEGDGDGDGAEQLIMTQRDEDTTMPEASAGLTGDDGPPKRQRVDPPHDVHDDDDDDDDEPFQIPELIIDDPSDEEVQ